MLGMRLLVSTHSIDTDSIILPMSWPRVFGLQCSVAACALSCSSESDYALRHQNLSRLQVQAMSKLSDYLQWLMLKKKTLWKFNEASLKTNSQQTMSYKYCSGMLHTCSGPRSVKVLEICNLIHLARMHQQYTLITHNPCDNVSMHDAL